MYNHILYILYWAVNILVLVIFSLVFPQSVVLGNFKFSFVEAAVYSGFWITVLFWAMWDYLYIRDVKLENLNGKFMVFWAFNFVSFWLVSRFPHVAGFGISSFVWALLLALCANFAQLFVWKMVVSRGKNSLALE